ncbi:MAG: hypothetical protein IJO39_02320, partial [Clostridia bacterium]|nr:hypothetical protein [Clostridia bacterium]
PKPFLTFFAAVSMREALAPTSDSKCLHLPSVASNGFPWLADSLTAKNAKPPLEKVAAATFSTL